MDQWWSMEVPPGAVDPMFLYELAEHLGMTVQQMTTGRPGMSARELSVGWPIYFRFKERAQKREADRQKQKRGRL